MGRTTKEQSKLGHERRMTRVKLGYCFTCGKLNDAHPEMIRCSSCRSKQCRARNQLRNERRQTGFCACGSPQFAGVRCRKCWFEEYSVKLYGTVKQWQLLEAQWDKQDGCCAYTGIRMTPGKTASIDHVVPKAKGGINAIENLQWVLKAVNYMKRDLLHDEFIDLCIAIAERGRPRKDKSTQPSYTDDA